MGIVSNNLKCVLLAERHYHLAEGLRDLLAASFDRVVMVADEPSLFEAARRLEPAVVVVDLALVQGENLDWLRRLRNLASHPSVVVMSAHGEPVVREKIMATGVDGFVPIHEIAARLLPILDGLVAGPQHT